MHGKLKISPGWIAALLTNALLGCGAPGAPAPPSLNLPIPVLNLSAARVGDAVHLAWTMPNRTTDHVALKHPIMVDVCRAVENLPCATIATLTLPPSAAGVYVDPLPAELASGQDRLLCFEVVLRNHAGKSAGPSNPAWTAAGPSPPALAGFSARVLPEGVLLSWEQVSGKTDSVFRIARRLLSNATPPDVPRSPLAPPLPTVDETLAVHSRDGLDPGHALDPSALFNQQYRYVAQRVATLAVSGHSVTVQGAMSEAITVSTKDIFPPAVPHDLAAVADSADGAIDLSWSPDADSDLAAYRVYRRDSHGALPPQAIASVGLETSFRDAATQREHTYAYSVAAIDQSGNESKRSPEVEETLPKP